MTTDLIAAHRAWDGNVLHPDLRRRFAAALGVADSRPAESCEVVDTLVAATGKTRGWRPYATPQGAHVLFAGFIDNRHELRRELGLAHADDGSLYAAGFAAWGDAIDLRAIGRFASIVVHPDGGSIRMARSPIIGPPLHYWHDQRRFIVASLSHAIFATGELERRVDRQKAADSLFMNDNEGSRSWFEGVERLPAGHRAVVSRKGIAIEAYYDWAAIPEVRLKSDDEYVEVATQLLSDGVKAALDGFSRPAVSLSGGFDSQAVAALASRCRPDLPIEAFTSVPEAEWDGRLDSGAFGNERAHVEAFLAMYPQVRPHWVDAAGLFIEHKLQALFLLMGRSPRNPNNMHWGHEIHAQARALGCDVMLGGDAGNLTFSYDGLSALATLARRGRWLRLWRDSPPLRPSRSRLRAMIVHGVLPNTPAWVSAALLKARAALGPGLAVDPYETWCPLNRDYAERMDVGERARSLRFDPLFRAGTSTRRARIEALILGEQDCADSWQAFDLLHGIESRDPTGYRPLVEFCLGIPDDQYLRNGKTRWLSRRMLKGLLPDMVLSETRRGRQTADWHLRLGRQREALIAEIDRLSRDDELATMLNFDSLRQALVDWPEHTPLGTDGMRLMYAVPLGLATAQFIRFAEGRNI